MNTARLSDGREVSTDSVEWRRECEARYLLAMPLAERREALDARMKMRKNIDALKAAMVRIHNTGRRREIEKPR